MCRVTMTLSSYGGNILAAAQKGQTVKCGEKNEFWNQVKI